MNERNILSYINSPFIINLKYAFQDRENLYLVNDLLTGGDLRYNMQIHKHFTEKEAKFIIA